MTATLDAEAALARRIRARGEEIRRGELETALDRLDAEGGLTQAQRAVVDEMTENLVDAVLDGPTAAVRAADDPGTLAAARTVFGPDE